MNICIYGASSAELEQIYYDKTEDLEKATAKPSLIFGDENSKTNPTSGCNE